VQFAQALVAQDFQQAHTLLSASLRKTSSVAQMHEAYENMMERGDGSPPTVELISAMMDWPARRKADVGWAYVAISGKTFSEAAAVIVKQEAGRLVIRHIVWSRL
jgi:hypothetical protein